MIIFAQCALKFKDAQYYAGENYPSQENNELDFNDSDNIMCCSESLIGFIDGYSPRLENLEINAKYLSNHVAQNIFTRYNAFFEGTEDLKQTKHTLEGVITQGALNGVQNYLEKIKTSSFNIYKSCVDNIPYWDDILNQSMNPIIEDGQTLKNTYENFRNFKESADSVTMENFVPSLKEAEASIYQKLINFSETVKWYNEEYLNQIKEYHQKINSSVSISVVHIVNNLDQYKNGFNAMMGGIGNFVNGITVDTYSAKTATIEGFQYGRSFVAIYRRVKYTEQKKDKYFYQLQGFSIFKTDYQIFSFSDLASVQDPELKKRIKFSFAAKETDLVLMSDSTLIDNIAISFVTVLLNLAIFKQSQDPNWYPDNDDTLNQALHNYVSKMSNPLNMKYVFGKMTENPAFAKQKEAPLLDVSTLENMQKLLACSMNNYFPTLRTNGEKFKSWVKYMGKNPCLDKITKKFFGITGSASPDFRKVKDAVQDGFSAQAISRTLGISVQRIQNCRWKPLVEGLEPVENFMSFDAIRQWRSVAKMQKDWALKEGKNVSEYEDFLSNWTVETFDQQLQQKAFAPIAGDMSIFVNMLIGDEAGKSTKGSVYCNEKSDPEGQYMQWMVEEFYSKGMKKPIVDQNQYSYINNEYMNNLEEDLDRGEYYNYSQDQYNLI